MKSNLPPRYTDEQINARIGEICSRRMTIVRVPWFVNGQRYGCVAMRVAWAAIRDNSK